MTSSSRPLDWCQRDLRPGPQRCLSAAVSASPPASAVDVNAALALAFRQEGSRLRAGLMRAIGDLAVVDDAVSAAVEQALLSWPSTGVPAVPAAWLTTVAKTKAVDVLRRRRRFADKEGAIARLEEDTRGDNDGGSFDAVDVRAGRSPLERQDDRLRLVFVSCHPVLPEDQRVALTLQAVGGLSAEEIARAFLVPASTMEKRLTRAKQKILAARVPFEVPPPDELAERLSAVLAVVYLIFNEGYLASKGEAVIRHELCADALRITRLLRGLLADSIHQPEVDGLLSLLLFTHARRAARVDDDGELVLLEDQDRARWDRSQMREAQLLVDGVLSQGRPGPYQIQAAIAALHAEASSTSTTDWAQIAALYVGLMRWVPTPVVRLNHAVAVAMAHGTQAGLALVEILGREGELDDYHLYWATRADLLRRNSDVGAARRAYQRARTLAKSPAEKSFLTRRLAALDPR